MNKSQKEVSDLEDIIEVHKNCLHGTYSEYMYGLLNGLICAHSVITKTSPKYSNIPVQPPKIRHKIIRKGKIW